jgi:hypothetical protein
MVAQTTIRAQIIINQTAEQMTNNKTDDGVFQLATFIHNVKVNTNQGFH